MLMVPAVRDAYKIQNFVVGVFFKCVIFVVVDLKLSCNNWTGEMSFLCPGKIPIAYKKHDVVFNCMNT